MKLVDVNILIYSVNTHTQHHTRIRNWWETALRGDEFVGLSWPVIVGFIRISTNPKAFMHPLDIHQALNQVEIWLNNPIVRIVDETEEHWTRLRQLLEEVGSAGNLTNDAHLAALASAIGATVVSCDTDFSRFRGLRWENPLDVPL